MALFSSPHTPSFSASPNSPRFAARGFLGVLLLVMDLSKRAWSGSKRARLFYAEQQRLWIELTRQIRGAFVWHHHKNEGELLLCLSDRLRIQFRDGFVEIGAGEFSVVPTHAIGLQRLGELAGSEI